MPSPFSQPPRFWAELKSPDFARLDVARSVAVLPLAATEQHGPHLPLSVDTDILNGIISHALPHLQPDFPVFFLPTQTVGRSIEHTAFAGTLTLGFASLVQSWLDLGECVARCGIKKLVLLNSHGGNVSSMDIVGRDLRARMGMTVVIAHTFTLPVPPSVQALFGAQEPRFGVHGGDMETSMMLALHPERVDMAQAENFHSSSQTRAQDFAILGNGTSAKLAWAAQDLNPQGVVGQAQAATAEKGQALLQASGQALAALLHEVQALPVFV